MHVVFAYIDPGSGSLMIQALIAGLVALPIFFRHQIARFVGALRRPSADQQPQPAPAPAEDDARPGA